MAVAGLPIDLSDVVILAVVAFLAWYFLFKEESKPDAKTIVPTKMMVSDGPPDQSLPEFTREDLRKYNGQNGQPIYIGICNKVFDCTYVFPRLASEISLRCRVARLGPEDPLTDLPLLFHSRPLSPVPFSVIPVPAQIFTGQGGSTPTLRATTSRARQGNSARSSSTARTRAQTSSRLPSATR